MTRCGQLNQLIARDMVVIDRKRALNYLEPGAKKAGQYPQRSCHRVDSPEVSRVGSNFRVRKSTVKKPF